MTKNTPLPALKSLGLGLAMAIASLTASAAPLQISGGVGLTSTAEDARDTFLAMTQGILTETFETQNGGIPPGPMSIFGGAGTLEQDFLANGTIKQGALLNGRFNTTPGCDINTACKWWETPVSFEVQLNSLHSAFGFFATDLGDLGGSVSLDFWNGASSVRSGVAVTSTNQVAGLLFFGYIDDTFSFNRITFNVMQTATNPINFDYVGFDDLLVGARSTVVTPPPTGVPAPAPLVLVGLGLGLMALVRRSA